MIETNNRRRFLLTTMLGATAMLVHSQAASSVVASEKSSALKKPNTSHAFVSLPAADLHRLTKSLESKPGANEIVTASGLPFRVRAISEQSGLAREFEIHKFRDHVVQVLAGETLFEIGGEAENPRNTGVGEQLAPSVKGSTSILTKEGDLLVIPRGIPHRRTTSHSVVMLVISVNQSGTAK